MLFSRAGRSFLAAAAVAVAGAILPAHASAADMAAGTIKDYACGDSCYLTLSDSKDGQDLTGLCAAPECDPWNEVAEMPSEMVGRKVTVTIEMGQQVDGEGKVMGEFPAFTEIVFEN